MSLHRLHVKQSIPATIDTCWQFFSKPGNLKKITPQHMGFEIHTPEAQLPMYQGMLIEYTVKPMLGIPMKWLTEISSCQAPHFFVDEQRAGPYTFWHHQHHFRAVDGGTEIEDIIHYRLPLGIIGDMVNRLHVANQLKGIFNYRKQVIEHEFGAFHVTDAQANEEVAIQTV